MNTTSFFRLSTFSKLAVSTACVAVAGWLAWSADAQDKEKKNV